MSFLTRHLFVFLIFSCALHPALSLPAPFSPALHQDIGGQCSEDTECTDNLVCINGFGPCSTSDLLCFCVPDTSNICESDEDCTDGSKCEDIEFGKFCAPNEQAEVEKDVCIDATALSDLPPHDLVFDTHRRSTVLCDEMGSCATKGHMVTWHNNPMMMRTYCQLVPCITKTMMVNSPRWKRALRVPSKTHGLHYLAFAARYETTAEERLMQAAVRLGL